MTEPFDKDIYYKNGEYIIKEIVCDYEIIDLRNNEEPAMILNCFHNAKLICDILKADELHEHFKLEHKPIEIAQMKYLEKEIAEKDKHIKELEEQIQGMVCDQIDLLAQANKELALYKKAFEIAKEDGLNMEDYFKEAKEQINENRNKI